MELKRFSVDRYKGYAVPATLELAPLTILVGANNSGKTALARGIQLLAGGLATSASSSEPVPLESGGILHGDKFEDLVTGRGLHGSLTLSASLASRGEVLSLSVTVRNVVTPGRPSERQVSRWALQSTNREYVLERQGFDERSVYSVAASGRSVKAESIRWLGLVPESEGPLPSWVEGAIQRLRSWAEGVRYLRCPRSLGRPPYNMPERPPQKLGSRGSHAPMALAADDVLRAKVRDWYRRAFDVHLELDVSGPYFDLNARHPAGGPGIALAQSGRGLAHALPVVVTALTAQGAKPGIDVIEHPEAELHPAAHAEVAEALLGQLAGPARPLLVETHSEMILLRARRRIAERKLSAGDVGLYWVQSEPEGGSTLRKITILENGQVDGWPDTVFAEDYEEILAIRRAARDQG